MRIVNYRAWSIHFRKLYSKLNLPSWIFVHNVPTPIIPSTLLPLESIAARIYADVHIRHETRGPWHAAHARQGPSARRGPPLLAHGSSSSRACLGGHQPVAAYIYGTKLSSIIYYLNTIMLKKSPHSPRGLRNSHIKKEKNLHRWIL